MRAVLFHAQAQRSGSANILQEFQREADQFGVPREAEELANGLWFLPIPECQRFLDRLIELAERRLGIVGKMLEVDYHNPWRTVSLSA
jgi:hypothetical protein